MKVQIKKGVLLFEIVFAILLVSIISLFLFRGYSIFIKSGRRGLDYLRLVITSEEKIWDLELKEKNDEIVSDMQFEGDIDSDFNWQLSLEDTEYDNFKKGFLKIDYTKRKISLDTVIYLNTEIE
jgi:hypothetical protein